jgi:ubiquinone/menaquinone biosynthesis C-methylase UbiE
MTARFDDPDGQYHDGANLRARIALHRRFGVAPQGWLPWLFDRISGSLGPRARILEVGCGTGQLWLANRARVPRGWQPVLSDRSRGMLAEARGALADAGLPSSFSVADVQALPYAPGTFDAVFANHMLYHVPDRVRALAEIARVLTEDGVLFAATNGRTHMRELDEVLLLAGASPAEVGSAVLERFTLENGAEQLRAAFRSVETLRHRDELRVTEVEPLVAYVASLGVGSYLLARFRAKAAMEIDTSGAMRIGKDAGLFVARRGA